MLPISASAVSLADALSAIPARLAKPALLGTTLLLLFHALPVQSLAKVVQEQVLLAPAASPVLTYLEISVCTVQVTVKAAMGLLAFPAT